MELVSHYMNQTDIQIVINYIKDFFYLFKQSNNDGFGQ